MSGDAVESAVRRIDEGDEPSPALTGPERQLDGRIRVIWALRTLVSAFTLGVGGAVVGFFVDDDPIVPGTVLFAVIFALGLAFAVLRYQSWRYEVRDDSLFLDRGVLTRVRTVVPYVRVQHVDVSRGPLERTLGLASVVVYTAGSRGADVTIPGLEPKRAEDLQARLKRLAIAAEGEDAV